MCSLPTPAPVTPTRSFAGLVSVLTLVVQPAEGASEEEIIPSTPSTPRPLQPSSRTDTVNAAGVNTQTVSLTGHTLSKTLTALPSDTATKGLNPLLATPSNSSPCVQLNATSDRSVQPDPPRSTPCTREDADSATRDTKVTKKPGVPSLQQQALSNLSARDLYIYTSVQTYLGSAHTLTVSPT
ncbi:hypothetical protein BaRGS_00023229 [Batillaria attramentaria]|uniref:Uncharacterized protein n=1 Tax=Batillaria attramentaria TaxID=370345 RepID=A0ABD0KEU4_9CAEN